MSAPETAQERAERIRQAAMRSHAFEGGGPFCTHWSGSAKETEFGTIMMSVQCGYPADLHPTQEES